MDPFHNALVAPGYGSVKWLVIQWFHMMQQAKLVAQKIDGFIHTMVLRICDF